MDVPIAAAPAQPVESAAPVTEAPVVAPVLTAVESATASGDVTAFRTARRAERSGTPAPAPVVAPEIPPVAAAVVPPERTVSKRQQQINDYERRIAAADAEIARLKTPPAAAAPRSDAPTPATVTFPEYAAYVEKHPDATLESYIDARQDFRAQQAAYLAGEARATTEAQRAQLVQAKAFTDRIETATAADPAFWDKVSPALTALETREAVLAAGRQPSASNDLASELIASEVGPQLLRHLTDHPDDLTKLQSCTTRGELLKVFGRLEARIESASAAAPPVSKPPAADLPNPPTTLGSRPAAGADPVRAAVANGDVVAFRAARLAERQAARR